MKYYASLLTLILLSACGKQATQGTPATAEDLAPYVNRFEQEMGVNASYVSVKFAPQTPPVLGYCESWSDGTRNVYIDPTNWASMDDSGKEQLMFHELGHCAMNLQHENEYVITPDNQSVYGSIMNQYWFGDSWFYLKYRSNYSAAMKLNAAMVP